MNGATGWKERIMDIGEKKITELVNQVLSAKGCEWSKEGPAELKKRIEELLLSLITSLDLPTKRDLDELNRRLETLNGKVVSLSLKVEKTLEGESGKEPARKRVTKRRGQGDEEEQ